MRFRQVSKLIGLAAAGLFAVSACDDETTTGVPVAESMVSSAGDDQSGTVGSVLPTSLEVTVTGSNGQPFSGATVQFTVQSRTGSVDPASATTGSDGKASTTLTLGTIAERVSVEARVGELTAEFSATALAGPATSIAKAGGDAQDGGVGQTLPVTLAVAVRDAHGNPVPGVTVDWTSAQGGTFAEQASDASGTARAAWTLANVGGAQSAVASFGGSTVMFGARAFNCDIVPVTIGTAINGSLSLTQSSLIESPTSTACPFLGTGSVFAAEFYSVASSAVVANSFDLTSSAFNPVLAMEGSNGIVFAVAPSAFAASATLARVVQGAGTYKLTATSAAPGGTGAFSLTSAASSVENDAGCAAGAVFLAPAVTTTQTIAATDCDFFTGFFSDWWSVYLEAGQSISLTETGVNFDPWIVGFRPTGVDFFNDGCPGVGVGLIASYTAAESGVHLFDIGTCNSAATGSYTLSYTVTSPSAPQGLAQARASRITALTLEELRDQVRRAGRK